MGFFKRPTDGTVGVSEMIGLELEVQVDPMVFMTFQPKVMENHSKTIGYFSLDVYVEANQPTPTWMSQEVSKSLGSVAQKPQYIPCISR